MNKKLLYLIVLGLLLVSTSHSSELSKANAKLGTIKGEAAKYGCKAIFGYHDFNNWKFILKGTHVQFPQGAVVSIPSSVYNNKKKVQSLMDRSKSEHPIATLIPRKQLTINGKIGNYKYYQFDLKCIELADERIKQESTVAELKFSSKIQCLTSKQQTQYILTTASNKGLNKLKQQYGCLMVNGIEIGRKFSKYEYGTTFSGKLGYLTTTITEFTSKGKVWYITTPDNTTQGFVVENLGNIRETDTNGFKQTYFHFKETKRCYTTLYGFLKNVEILEKLDKIIKQKNYCKK